MVEFLDRVNSNRPVAIYFVVPPEPFRSQFERPCKDQSGDQADCQDNDDIPNRIVTEPEGGKDRFYYLGDQLSRNDVSGSYAEHVSALQFVE